MNRQMDLGDALWMFVFTGLSLAIGIMLVQADRWTPVEWALATSAVVMFGGVLAAIIRKKGESR